MAVTIEIIRPTATLRRSVVLKPNGKVRSEQSVRRFLLEHDGYKFIGGKLSKKESSSAKHSGISTRLTVEIGIYLKSNIVGRVYADNTLFKIGENRRISDAAFVSAAKIPAGGEPLDIWDFAPDIAVEVISPSERHNEVEAKIRDYFAAGVLQVWKIIPELKTLTVYFSPTETKILTETDELTCEQILPDFSLKLSDIFID